MAVRSRRSPRRPQRRPQRRPRSQARGSLLLLVLVVVGMLTVSGMAFFEWSFLQYRAADANGRKVQTRALAQSGIAMVQTMLLEDPLVIEQGGGLYNNPSSFQGAIVADSDAAALRARVSVMAPLVEYGDYVGYRFGLENESSKINLNTLLLADEYLENGARLQLMQLPGMTEMIADAILDWLDEDDELRDFGAESTYYSSLSPGYAPQNGPLESIDQLLLVRDVTPDLLYGLDVDRNFVVSPAEAARVLPPEVNNANGEMNRGWAAYFTLYSAESLTTADGVAKIDVNMEDLEALHEQLTAVLTAEQANFIVAYRQGGAVGATDATTTGTTTGTGAGTGAGTTNTTATRRVSPSSIQIDFETEGAETIPSILALIGVDVEFAENNESVILTTPFPDSAAAMVSFLPTLLENLTTSSTDSMVGRININQAPRAVLRGIPNMPAAAVEQIISTRNFELLPERPEQIHAEWLLMDGLVDLATMKMLSPLVTGGGDVYRAQVVGFFDEESPSTRLEVIIDATQATPQVLQTLDLSPLGAGLTPQELGAGVSVEPTP